MNKFFIAIATLMIGTPVMATGTFEDHQELWNSLQSVGVRTEINSKDCSGGSDGFYQTYRRRLVICQDNGGTDGREVGWTRNDLDTLRHEAHHVVQDCLGGRPFDGRLDNLFEDKKLAKFVTDRLSEDQIKFIIQTYSEKGAPDHVIMKELEAFAVASAVSPTVISTAVRDACGV